MTERIKVAEYHGRPLVELEMGDGIVWRLRQPLEADYYRITEGAAAYNKRVRAYSAELAKRAMAAAEVAGAAGDDGLAEANKLVEEESAEERLPLEVSERYQFASVLAIFIEPEQTPEAILERLGPDIVHELFLRVMEVLGGDAAKKRLAASSPVTT